MSGSIKFFVGSDFTNNLSVKTTIENAIEWLRTYCFVLSFTFLFWILSSELTVQLQSNFDILFKSVIRISGKYGIIFVTVPYLFIIWIKCRMNIFDEFHIAYDALLFEGPMVSFSWWRELHLTCAQGMC